MVSVLNAKTAVRCGHEVRQSSRNDKKARIELKQFGENKIVGAERYFWSVDVHWKMLENYNSTAMDVYMNMSYQLGLDWNISIFG